VPAEGTMRHAELCISKEAPVTTDMHRSKTCICRADAGAAPTLGAGSFTGLVSVSLESRTLQVGSPKQIARLVTI
jgi:hypothetical protein